MSSKSSRLRELLSRDEVLVTPGVYNPLSALLVQKAGFDAAWVSSFALCGSMGICDIGVVSLTEVADWAARIARSVDMPVVCDVEAGYGNYMNAMRTVELMEAGSLAGLCIEDGRTPHKSSLTGSARPLVSLEEMVDKIRAVVEARKDPNFFIAARTDAARTPGMGLDEAIRRGHAFAEAGADAIVALDISSPQDMKQFNDEVKVPSVGVISTVHPPYLTVAQLGELGFKIVIPSTPTFYGLVQNSWELLQELKSTGSLENIIERLAPHPFVKDLLGFPRWEELETRYKG